MRILNVISGVDPESGGPTEVLRQQALSLAQMGHESEIATCDDPDAPFVRDFPVKVHALGPGQGKFVFTPRLTPWLMENAQSFDAVVVHGLWQYSGLGTRTAMRRLGRPYHVFCHGMLDPWFKREFPLKHLKKSVYWYSTEYRVLRDAKTVIYTCEDERLAARQSFPLYRATERIVPLGIAPPQGNPDAQRSAFLSAFPELRGREFLLFLSRLHPKKGCDLLIEAFAKVFGAGHDLCLVMAGPDQVGWMPELKQMAHALGLAERVVWTGMIRDEIKWGAYRACQAMTLPSHQENFGIVVAEALACGTPVLISEKVNIWREVVQDHAGLSCSDDKEGVASMLNGWSNLDESAREAMGTAARACYEGRFELSKSTEELVKVLQ